MWPPPRDAVAGSFIGCFAIKSHEVPGPTLYRRCTTFGQSYRDGFAARFRLVQDALIKEQSE